MVGSTAFGAIVQKQDKKLILNKSADSTYTINTSDGNQHIMISAII